MKICPQCGNENQENAKFCKKCGNDLQNIAPSQPQMDFNPNNNNTYQQQNYQQQNYQQQSNYQTHYQPRKHKITWLGPLLNILGGLLFYFLTGIGQLYLGLYKRGILICLIGFIPVIIGMLSITIFSETMGSLISLIIGVPLMLYSAYDAYQCANAINEGSPIPLLFGSINIE